jgi:phage terminase large subunit-like protein
MTTSTDAFRTLNGASLKAAATRKAKIEKLLLLQERERRQRRTKLLRYRPYAKQREFHAAGAIHRERLFKAGNQLGKTYCGAAEAAFHLTGKYPADWDGRRFDRPVTAWAGSETNEVTRDGVQRLLVGPPKIETEWGTGLIPGDDLLDWSRRQGVPDALDGVVVQHWRNVANNPDCPRYERDGLSTLGFKSYDQGRTKWQGETLDFVWFDEEPPADIYTEGLTRTNATRGMVWLTFTPLKGMSEVVHLFKDCPGF